MTHELAFCDLPPQFFDALGVQRIGYSRFSFAFWLTTQGPEYGGGGADWIRPCVICGCSMVPSMLYWPRGQTELLAWTAACCHCGSHGPIGATPDDAEALWNSGKWPRLEPWDQRVEEIRKGAA